MIRDLLARFGPLRRGYHWLRRNLGRARDFLYLVPMPRALQRPQADVIVSLTSYPPRIGWVAATIESIRRQTIPPRRIILTLSKEDFPDQALPQTLRRLVSRGLEVVWTNENHRSFKKLIPIRALLPDDTIVTIDDDTIYSRDFLAGLVHAAKEYPDMIIGYRGWALSVSEERVAPYRSLAEADPSTPPDLTLLTGVGGILYPPGSLSVDDLIDITTAQRICPSADDVWFWAIARHTGTKTVCLGGEVSKLFRGIEALRGGPSLGTDNVLRGHNDRQIAAVIQAFDLWGKLQVAQLDRPIGHRGAAAGGDTPGAESGR